MPKEGIVNMGRKTKTLLVCGVIAGPLFIVAFLFEDATEAEPAMQIAEELG